MKVQYNIDEVTEDLLAVALPLAAGAAVIWYRDHPTERTTATRLLGHLRLLVESSLPGTRYNVKLLIASNRNEMAGEFLSAQMTRMGQTAAQTAAL